MKPHDTPDPAAPQRRISNLPECAPDCHLAVANQVIVTAVRPGWLSLAGDTGPLPFVVSLVTSEHLVKRLELTGLVRTEEPKQRIGDRLGALKACPRRTRAEDAIGREQRHGSLAIASVQGVVQGANGRGSCLFLGAHAQANPSIS